MLMNFFSDFFAAEYLLQIIGTSDCRESLYYRDTKRTGRDNEVIMVRNKLIEVPLCVFLP